MRVRLVPTKRSTAREGVPTRRVVAARTMRDVRPEPDRAPLREHPSRHPRGGKRRGRLAGAGALVRRLALLCAPPVHGRARRRDRERRAAVDPDRPRVLAGEPAVGAERLRARVRRLPPARRTRRRPPRPPARPDRRRGAVHARARCSAGSPGATSADRVPRAPGARRRDRLARSALDHLGHVRRGPRAQHRPRRLGRRRRLRRGRRRAARRRPHRPAQLGVDLLRQRAGRHRGRRAAPALLDESRDARVHAFDALGAVLVTAAWSRSSTRSRRRRRHGWLGPDDRRLRRSPPSCSPASSSGSCARPSR